MGCSHQIYFDTVHPSMPMMHKYRYLAAMDLYVPTLLSTASSVRLHTC